MMCSDNLYVTCRVLLLIWFYVFRLRSLISNRRLWPTFKIKPSLKEKHVVLSSTYIAPSTALPKYNWSKVEICEVEMGVECELIKYMYTMLGINL